MKILVIAPHPDDEVLGCGGTIAKHSSAGDDVTVCIVTRAYTPDWSEEYIQNKAEEIERSCGILGINKKFKLNYPTVMLDTYPQKDINKSLEEVYLDVEPDIVYIPHGGDLNKDHRIIHDAALVALRPLSHKAQRILSYETLSESEWGPKNQPFLPCVYCDISDYLQKKIEAMEAYQSELKQYPHPRSTHSITALAEKRGSEICVQYAESFMLIREIV